MQSNDYVEARGAGWYVRNSRVALGPIVYAFRSGLSPEAISRECFPSLNLEQVYGALTYYLANRTEVDAFLCECERECDTMAKAQRGQVPTTFGRFTEVRREMGLIAS